MGYSLLLAPGVALADFREAYGVPGDVIITIVMRVILLSRGALAQT